MNNKNVFWFISVVVIFLVGTTSFSKFYSVRSESEFDRKLRDFEYSFVCFAQDNVDGDRIKEMLRSLASSEEFEESEENGLVFLFVNGDHALSRRYNHTGKPLFVIFNRKKILAEGDLGEHYTIKKMRDFINEVIYYNYKAY